MNLFKQRILTASNLSTRSCLSTVCPIHIDVLISFLGTDENTSCAPHNQAEFLKKAPADLTKVSKQLTRAIAFMHTNLHTVLSRCITSIPSLKCHIKPRIECLLITTMTAQSNPRLLIHSPCPPCKHASMHVHTPLTQTKDAHELQLNKLDFEISERKRLCEERDVLQAELGAMQSELGKRAAFLENLPKVCPR